MKLLDVPPSLKAIGFAEMVSDNFRALDQLVRNGVRAPHGTDLLPSIGGEGTARSGGGFYSLDGARGWGFQADTLRQRAIALQTGAVYEVGPNGVPESGDRARLSAYETDPKIADDVSRIDLFSNGTVVGLRSYARGAGTARAIAFGFDTAGTFTEVSRFTTAGFRLSGALTFFPDDTYDIGADLATRPKTGYFGTSLFVGPKEAGVATADMALYRAGDANFVVRDTTNNVEFAVAASSSGVFLSSKTNHKLFLQTNNTNRLEISADGTAWVISTATSITLPDACDIVLNGTTGTKIGTATTQKLSVWNATPIAQPSSTGETNGFSAGAGTNVTDQSTFTGNVGSTAYRISDIVKHLKNIGWIAS